jgi:hypothetical protein
VRLILGDLAGTLNLRNISLRDVGEAEVKDDKGDLVVHDIEAVVATPSKPNPTPEPKPKPKRKRKPKVKPVPDSAADGLSAIALIEAFEEDPAKARKAHQGEPIHFTGHVSNLEPALLGDVLLELEDGRISILVKGEEIDAANDRMIKAELAAAKRRIAAYTRYAKDNGIPAAERRKRVLEALPTATLTASFIGYRNGSIKMRHGKNITFEKGQPLFP